MLYELWNTDSGNLVGAYTTKDEALNVVREAVRRHGHAYVHAWSLGSVDGDGHDEPIVEGSDLAALAGLALPA